MESQISPKNIQERVEKLDAATKPVETPAPIEPASKVETPAPAAPVAATPAAPVDKVATPADKVSAPVDKVSDTAPVEKPAEKRKPNDPDELRKWSTKLSQENAALRDEMKAIKAAIEKMSKKPVDYATLAKDPEGLKRHIEEERQEAVRDLQAKLKEKQDLAIMNETKFERVMRERDKENYPRWEKLFPLIQTLAANSDGRVNWNHPEGPGAALDEAYALAAQLSPSEAAAAPAAPQIVPAAPVAPVMTEEQIQARVNAAVEAAVSKVKADSATGLQAEQNGAGIGSSGKGGRRDSSVSKEALQKMPLADLKKMISKE
jgi:hypothetical protein